MMKRYVWIAGFLMLALCTGRLSQAQASEEAPLEASGTIRATEIRIASELGGRVQALVVDVGDTVAAGDVLALMDATPWQLQLGPAEAGVAVAQADLAALLAGAYPAEIDAARAALALAEAQRDGALRDWENAQATVENPQALNTQIIQARTQVALAEQGVAFADAELRNVQYLYDRQSATLWELQAAQAAFASAQADLRTAKTLLSHLYTMRNEPLGYQALANAAEGQYRVAEAGVAVAQAQLDDLLAGPSPEEIAVAEAAVHQAQAEAGVLRVQIDKCILASPIEGIVLDQMVRLGELAAPAATLLTLADLSVVTLEVYVPENRIGHVQLGQPVAVTVDSFPERVFEGRVTGIADQPEFTPRNVATAEERLNTFYAVEIRLPNPDRLLKPGMPADAAF